MGILTIKNVSKSFGGLRAISDLSLDLEPGQIVGLIGPNGSGKTTLFNLVTGFLRPDRGDVLFEGTSIVGLKPHVLCARGISRTFQLVKPFLKLTLLENVMIGAFHRTKDPARAEEIARDVISRFDFREKIHHPASALTLPERKELEIARTLATGPRLLLLDESMAGLTPTEIDRMIVFLRRLKQESGVTLLVIEHVMRAIMSISDRIVVIHHGEKIAEGVPEDVANDPGVVAAYLGGAYRLA